MNLKSIERCVRSLAAISWVGLVFSLLYIERILRPLYSLFFSSCLARFKKTHNMDYHKHIYSRILFPGLLNVLGVQIVENNQFKKENQKSVQENRQNGEQERGTLLMFQHVSNIDAFLLGKTFSHQFIHFIAKKVLFKVPFYGQTLSLLGHISIDRKSLKSAVSSLDGAVQHLKEHKSWIAISPEGTRRRSSSHDQVKVQEFKKGPFHVAKNSGANIIPFVIQGGNRLWPPGQAFPQPGTVVVKQCRMIKGSKVEAMTVDEMKEEVRQNMVDNYTVIEDRIVYNDGHKQYWLVVICIVYPIVMAYKVVGFIRHLMA